MNDADKDCHKFSGIKRLTSAPGDLYDFQEKYKPYVWRTYRTLGMVVMSGEEYTWPTIEELPSGASASEKALHKKQLESQEERKIKYEEDKLPMIGDILEHLDASSLALLEIQPDFKSFIDSRDPISLWKLIKQTLELSGAERRAQKIQERRLLRDTKQLDDESIEELSLIHI